MKKIYVYGDSISLDWEIPFYELIKNDFEVCRIGSDGKLYTVGNRLCNGMSTREMLRCLEGESFSKQVMFEDILLFNCGLHDIMCNKNSLKHNVTLDEYKMNLERISSYLENKFNKVFWISTTPVDDVIHNSYNKGFYRYNEDVCCYNKSANNIINSHGFKMIDLYTFSCNLDDANIYRDHVHMRESVSKEQAIYIRDIIKQNM